MKKNYLTIALVAIIFGLLWWNVENREFAEAYRLEKQRNEVNLKRSIDSATRVGKFRTDSIVVALESKRLAEVDKKDQLLKTEIKRRKRAEVKLVAYTRDSQRDSVLSELYASKADSLTYATPVNYFDSLTYETRLGRSCAELSASQDSLIQAQSLELIAGDKLTKLQGAQIANFEFRNDQQNARFDNAQELFTIEKSTLKTKVRKQKRTILGLSGLSAVLLAVLIL